MVLMYLCLIRRLKQEIKGRLTTDRGPGTTDAGLIISFEQALNMVEEN
jgi:hypothetical protein